MHWAPVYEVVFGWFLRRTHGAVLRIGMIKDGLGGYCGRRGHRRQLAFQPTISTESGPQNG